METQCTTNTTWLQPVAKCTGFQMCLCCRLIGTMCLAAKAGCFLMCYRSQTLGGQRPLDAILFSLFTGALSYSPTFHFIGFYLRDGIATPLFLRTFFVVLLVPWQFPSAPSITSVTVEFPLFYLVCSRGFEWLWLEFIFKG